MIAEIADILIMTLFIYSLLVWFKKTRAAFVLTGILIIGAIYLLANHYHLSLTTAVLKSFFTIFLVAIVVIFQEELRHFFEQIAVWGLNRNRRHSKRVHTTRKEVEILVRSVTEFSKLRIGALIVLQGKDPIMRHLSGGHVLNGELSVPLLESLFDPHSDGHDGGVVVERGRVVLFACHLPLSKNFQKLIKGGTRHAAALGLAERSDALSLVVSEERGDISIARHGELTTFNDVGRLTQTLERFYRETAPTNEVPAWQDFFKRNYQEKVLSLLIACTLWFVLVHEASWMRKSFELPIQNFTIPSDLKIGTILPDTVEVTLGGARRAFYLVNSDSIQLNRPIHLTQQGRQTVTLHLDDFSVPQGVSVESIEPNILIIDLVQTPSE